jgi:hypothetical protein
LSLPSLHPAQFLPIFHGFHPIFLTVTTENFGSIQIWPV